MHYVKKMKQSEVAARLGKDQSAISRLLKECEATGVVAYTIDADFAIRGQEREYLADDLMEDFGLKDAIVVQMNPSMSGSAGDYFSDDDLHTALANHTGLHIRENGIENEDHIAVAGGRTVVRLTHVISANPPSRHDVVVTPLGGRLWTGFLFAAETHGPQHLEQPLNPDDSAHILAAGIHAGQERGIKFSQVNNPLFAGSVEQAQAAMRSNCAFLPGGEWNKDWNLKPPTKAFVGVGVVDRDSNHRIAEYLKLAERSGSKVRLQPPYGILAEQLQSVDTKRLAYFGDVANRLFAALPIVVDKGSGPLNRGEIAADSDELTLARYTNQYEVLIQELDSLNSMSVVAEWSHLRSIPSVRAIAGGAFKVNVLWTLLVAGLTDQRIITGLSTDATTAATLSVIRKRYEKATPEVKQWFRKTITRIFQDGRHTSG